MLICGLQKTTLLDFPGHVACTIFTGGCNFLCPYCHNMELVQRPKDYEIPEEEIRAFLRKRRGILEGVCVTGGEPTLHPDLKEFLGKIKELGYLVKLDSNGSRPEVLQELMESGLVDYVAMDVKASREHYPVVAGAPCMNVNKIDESIRLLMGQTAVPYEFRTTVVGGLHTASEVEEIGKWIAGARAFYLQSFRESENVPEQGRQFYAFSKEELELMAEKARKYIARVEVRGVE